MDYIEVSHAKRNNLKDVSVRIPRNKFVGFIGKSGSGKSTLAVDVIYAAYLKEADNVNVFGAASLFKQVSSLNNQRGTVSKYLFGAPPKRNVENISQVHVDLKNHLLNENDMNRIVSMLELTEVSLSSSVCMLSMSTYNKIRFLKMLLTKKSDVLIVDELAAGLSYREAKIIGKLFKFLIKKGYTVLAIEHSMAVIEECDYIVELGPDAGARGGEILFSGFMEEYAKTDRWTLMKSEQNKTLPIKHIGRKKLEIKDINYNGFHHIDVQIPLNAIVNICGETASGKSVLLDIIYRAFDKSADSWKNRYGIDGEILGKSYIRRAYVIDQSPVGKNSMSSIATYSGIMESIRKIYANSSLSCDKAYTISDFSYNGKHGCKKCSGRGYFSKLVDENEMFLQCSSCLGKRYEPDILSVIDCGLNIGEFLQIPCDELYKIYSKEKSSAPVTKKIEFINAVGLSYVCLGQPSGTLSGGESQRLKITKELAKKLGDRCVFILDNPTKGLHILDCENMINILKKLVTKNNSVIVSDNSPFMIRNSDYLIVLEKEKIPYCGLVNNLSSKYKKTFGIKD